MEKGNQLMEKLSKAYASLPDNEPLKADIFAVAQDLEKMKMTSWYVQNWHMPFLNIY